MKCGCMARARSPAGCSSLITSAPRSASTWVQYGPDSTCVMSSTRSPASSGAPVMALFLRLQIIVGELDERGVDRALEGRVLRGDQAARLEPVEVAAHGGEVHAAPRVEPGRGGGGEHRAVLHPHVLHH